MYTYLGGTRWRSWLRHCATNRKVAGSIPDGVIGIFHLRNPSGRTMALELTQPLTEMSTRNISWGKGGRLVGLTTFMCRLSWNLGASTSWNPQGLSRPVMRLIFFMYTHLSRSQWPRSLRRRSAAARLLRSWVRIPRGAWMFVYCECCVLSGRGFCDELITRPVQSYRLWCVVVCDLEPQEWGGRDPGWVAAPQHKKKD